MSAEYLHLEYRSRVYRLNRNFTVQSIISLKYILNYSCSRLCGPPYSILTYFFSSVQSGPLGRDEADERVLIGWAVRMEEELHVKSETVVVVLAMNI